MDFINEDVLRILLSMIAGSIIGAEREYKSKNAGFRTITLITMGATLYTLLSRDIADGKDFHVVGNIVVGVGFLGAGAIFKDASNVSGLTTAATIWISAAIGMAIGSGAYQFAFFTFLLLMVILLGFSGIQSVIDKKNAEKYYKISIKNNPGAYLYIESMVKKCGLSSRQIAVGKAEKELRFTVKISGGNEKHRQLVDILSSAEEIESFEV